MAGFKIHIDKNELLKVIDSKMDEIVDDIFANSQQNIVNNSIIDEGTLLKSGNINRQFLNKQIVYSVPYADTIEYGRLPGSMPPIESIKGWVRRKLGINDDKEITRIAWAISKDIEKNGTQPRPFLTPAIDSARIKYNAK